MAGRRLTAAGAPTVACARRLLGLLGGLTFGLRPLRLADGASDVAGDLELLVEVRRAGVGLRRLGAAEIQRLVDRLPAGQLVPVHQGDRHAGLACAPGAADAVHVSLLVFGNLVV